MTREIREEIYQREERRRQSVEGQRKEAERQVERDLTSDEPFVF